MILSRIKVISVLVASFLIANASADEILNTKKSKSSEQKPNLIIILTDDQGYKDVGFNGSTDIKTPHIDQIAKQGTRFTNGYVTFSVCGPSRAGLLTGRHQERFGFSFNPTLNPSVPQNGLPTTEKNIAEVLQPAGYTSGVLGKWHMGTHPDLHPNKRGFDYFYGFLSGGHQYFPEDLTINDLSEVKYRYDWYRTRLLRNDKRIDIDEYLTDELSHEAVDFIKREKDNPFFLYVSYNAPHSPLQASQKYLDRYQHIKDKKRRTYAAMVSAVDDGVGRIMQTLKEQGIDDNTIVFFLSDNGGPEHVNASDNGELRDGKNSLFEGGVRVPFAVRWPNRIPAGVDYNKAVSSLDIMATIVAQAGIDVSNNKPLDGVDLLPYLTNENNSAPHDVLFWRHVKANSYAMRSGNDKMVQKKDQSMLFDLSDDIGEQNNLLQEQEQAQNKTHQALQKSYQQWEEQLSEPAFPDANQWKKKRPKGKGQGQGKGKGKNKSKNKANK